ncbi:MAG: Hpt domain-containing protein [Lachnospiraceae bacterium]|nr:Hpt domain-containing protein [Lachnospiraceae bacterium]
MGENYNLPTLEGFDLNIAMDILQSEEVVQVILIEFDDFLEQIGPKLDKLYSENMSEKDMKNYRMTVHSLKSSAATVGAMELSELARTQEMAAIDRDQSKVTELHPRVMEMVTKIKSVLHPYIETLM